ncbi:MAG: ribonuclease J [Pseudomonadota bacterium]
MTDDLQLAILSGTRGIGMNMAAYGHRDDWIVVDSGVKFADQNQTPGIDTIFVDPDFLYERRDQVKAFFITHAHEDHFGALIYHWPAFECPVYASPFTAALWQKKYGPMIQDYHIQTTAIGESQRAGCFDVRFLPVTHSVPDSCALSITCQAGTVVHSGDFSIGFDDQHPGWQDLKNSAPLALVCDSTGVFEGHSQQNDDSVKQTIEWAMRQAPARAIITCFASHIARVRQIIAAAHACNRRCALLGRSMYRCYQTALATGHVDEHDQVIEPREVLHLPRNKQALICTGNQGEPRAALTQMAQKQHPHVRLQAGDTVIFSAREIPGNELVIGHVQNKLVRQGMNVVTWRDDLPGPIHASGHSGRDELLRLYQYLNPRTIIPVHGEPRHIKAHEIFAQSKGFETVTSDDGVVISLHADRSARIIATNKVNLRGLDGRNDIALDDISIKERKRFMTHGALFLTLMIDTDGTVMPGSQFTLHGLAGIEDPEELKNQVNDALARNRRRRYSHIEKAVTRHLRAYLKDLYGKKPKIIVHIIDSP